MRLPAFVLTTVTLWAHGSREMPVWGETYKPSLGALGEEKLHARIEALMAFIEGLQALITRCGW